MHGKEIYVCICCAFVANYSIMGTREMQEIYKIVLVVSTFLEQKNATFKDNMLAMTLKQAMLALVPSLDVGIVFHSRISIK